MRRLVLLALVVESLVGAVVAFGVLTDRSDAAGRGLGQGYALVIALPVVVALALWFSGWWRAAGGALLVLPVLAAYSFWADAQRDRGVQASAAGDGWFSDPGVLALTRAMAAGDTAAMRRAIVADPRVVNAVTADSGGTVLTHAIWHAPNMVQPLLELGADPNLAAPRGLTPLAQAVGKDAVLVRALLTAGGDPNGHHGREPVIFTAFRGGREAEAMALAVGGADATRRGDHDETTAHAAARHYLWDVAAALVERGSDPAAPNARGETLLQLVQDPALAPWRDHRGFVRLVAAIRARGHDVTLPSPDSARGAS